MRCYLFHCSYFIRTFGRNKIISCRITYEYAAVIVAILLTKICRPLSYSIGSGEVFQLETSKLNKTLYKPRDLSYFEQ